jgi:hypothetical protein
LGAAAVSVGSYFGIRALVLRARSDKHFDGRYCTEQSCVDDWNSAKTASSISNVAFVVGAVSLGAGGYFLLRPSPVETPRRPVTVGAQLSTSGIWASATGEF